MDLKPVYDIPAKEQSPSLGHNTGFPLRDFQVAPQETEVESYVVGGIKQDVKKDTFTGFQTLKLKRRR